MMSIEVGLDRFLGIDFGEKRVGIAVSDALGITAQSVTTIDRTKTKPWLKILDQLIEEYAITAIVVGLPRNMDGSLSEKGEQSLQLAETLKQRYNLPVHLWDERLSTVAVERTLIEANMTRKKRKGVIDQLAATWILQGFLEAQRR